MKKRKNLPLLILLIAFVVLCVIYLLLKNYVSKTEEAESSSDEGTTVYEIDSDDIAKLSFYISDEKYTFIQGDDGWTLKNHDTYPVDEDQIGNLTSALSDVKAQRELDDVDDLSEYGLDDPEDVVTIKDTDGNKTKITIGDTNEAASYCYIYLNDDTDKVYAISSDFATVFSGNLTNYAKEDSFPTISSSNVTQLQVSGGDSDYTFSQEDDSSNWILTDAQGNETEISTTNMSTVLSAATEISYSSFLEYDCQDFSQYGLDQPARTVTITYTSTEDSDDDDSDDTDSSDSDSEDSSSDSDSTDSDDDSEETVVKTATFYIGNSDGSDGFYVRTDDSTQVHSVSADSLDSLINIDPASLENMSFSAISLSNVDQMSVTLDGENHVFTITREESSDDDSDDEDSDDSDSDDDSSSSTTTTVSYDMDGEELEATDFSTFFNTLTAITAQKSTTENPVNDATFSFVFTSSDGSTTSIDYSPYDNNFYMAVRSDGKKYLVNKVKVKNIISDYKELISSAGSDSDSSSDTESDS